MMTQPTIPTLQIERELAILTQRVQDLERLASERKDFREQLKTSEERYRSISQHSPSAYALAEIVTDAGGRAVDFAFLEVNRAFEAVTGVQSEDVVGRRAGEVFPGIEGEPILEVFSRVAASRRPFDSSA